MDFEQEVGGEQAFAQLKEKLDSDSQLRQEVQWLLQLGLNKFNPSERGNRWISGSIVEWALALASFEAGLVTLPDGHGADGHDLIDLRKQAKGMWSVKSSYQSKRSDFIITNGLGGSGGGLQDVTLFLHPLLHGIVMVSPGLHKSVVDQLLSKAGETRLPFKAVEEHKLSHPECSIELNVPINDGHGGHGDPGLDAVRLLTSSGVFTRLNKPFQIIEDREGGDLVMRLREIQEMKARGELSEDQAQLAMDHLLS